MQQIMNSIEDVTCQKELTEVIETILDGPLFEMEGADIIEYWSSRLNDLEARLNEAVDSENFEKIAKFRIEIQEAADQRKRAFLKYCPENLGEAQEIREELASEASVPEPIIESIRQKKKKTIHRLKSRALRWVRRAAREIVGSGRIATRYVRHVTRGVGNLMFNSKKGTKK